MSGEKQKRKSQAPVETAVEDNDSSEEMNLSDDEGTLIDGIRIPPPGKPVCSFDPKGPRLVITKISNVFFKSYAEEQVLGPFHKCFNAIVGPNGSGKSNVIDSMLFVFGYRATKIRSKKVSVLLHNSDKYQNIQSCRVSVHFAQIIDKSGDDYEIVPGSEFVVSRTANKDNSSYYMMGKQRVQFKEVAKLLKQHGIDLDHNRFLILQGEVEQIAMMKCKGEGENETGMLEYLEDIIGTSRFKKPLAEVQERVDFLTEHRTEKLNRVQLVEKELEKLKAPMEEAVGFLKAENTVVNSKNFLYQKNIYDIETKMEAVEVSRKEVLEKQKEFEDNMEKLNQEKHEKEKILKQESEKYEKLQNRKDTMTEAFNKANNKDIQLQEDMTQTNKTRKKTKELIVEEKKKLEKLAKVPEESKNGIEECEAKIKEVSSKKEKYEEEKTKLLTNIRNETKPLQEKKEEIQNDLVVLKKSVDETKAAFSLAESELKIYVSSTENEGAKLENLKKEYETSKSTIEERVKQVSSLKKKIPATEKSLKDATEELNTVKYQEAQIINEIRKNRSNLEEKKNSMQASRSQGKVLDGLMRQKNEGNCPGLYGRLGDLGAIDKKYDVAISTACGPLDNIVVDSVDTAQWCIEFLKKYDLGRATFIALDKQEHLRNLANTKINTPENVHRLFDLVKIQDENVRPAFYYALRDTLVANDLDQASRIAYGAQRFRVVTLEGHLIETTGTMSGGGKTVSRGRMGQSVRVSNVNPKELENMQEDIETLENSVRELRQKQTSLENQINTLEPELRQMIFDSKKFSMELQELQQRVPLLEKQVKTQEAKSKAAKADPAEVKRLTKIVDQKRALYEQAAETADELQVQVDKISREISEKSSGKMKAADKNISEATKTIDKCKAEITRLRVAITTAERNAKKSEQKIKTMEQDVVDMEDKLRRMKNERTEIEEDAAKLLKCIEEITELMTEGEEAFSIIKKEVADLTKRVNELKSEKVDVDQKVKTLNSKVNDYKGAIHQLEVKLSRLELQDVLNESESVLKKYTREELEEMDAASITREMEAAENHIKVAKPNLSAIEEYRKQQGIYVERSKELEQISNKRMEMRALMDSLRLQRKEEFTTGFNIIRSKLKEMYQMITLGGDADFEMVDNYDPFTEGIQFNVRPPKKSWKQISNLSGGEKTLASLALVFALHYYKPSPLYVMDEIDAALDFKNVSIVGNYIKERTKNAQFIIISLRSNMFELCDNLIGIYKTYDCTKTITIDPRVYEKKEEQPVRRLNATEKSSIARPNSESVVKTAGLSNGEEVVNGTNNECIGMGEPVVNETLESSSFISQRSNTGEVINDSFQSEGMEEDS